uniref:ABC transmembrane type-2 domain-containing protein n=1 Tax=Glossina brevipalpis TaxID=37001 RepID=A0A1A9WH88_9MUSC
MDWHIGLLRGGRMLAEESPQFLRQQYNAESLEDVFLKLAVMQNMGKRRRSSIAKEVIDNVAVPALSNPALDLSDEQDNAEISGEFGDNISMTSAIPDPIAVTTVPALPVPPEEDVPASYCNKQLMSKNHLHALIWKNFLWMLRNKGSMLFVVGLPIIQTFLFCYAIGHDPTGLKLAVANHELNEEMITQQHCPSIVGCNQTQLSCRYLDMLVRNRSMMMIFTHTDDEAADLVRQGKAWGSLTIANNFTQALTERIESGRYADNGTLDASELNLRLDMSNQQISTILFRDLVETYFNFMDHHLTDCDINPGIARIPVIYQEPIYGTIIPSFNEFVAPGVILTIIFFLSVAITTGAMLLERNEGMLERCLVAGITGPEILFSLLVTQFTVMFLQCIFVLLVVFYFFNMTLNGSIWSVLTMSILSGLCGMSYGFVISCAVDTERTATYVAMGSFLPTVTLCGIIWPMEGMYPLLRIVSKILPLTKPIESLRSILQRGWGLTEPTVYYGFISITTWVIVFLVMTILLLKFKKG